MDNIKKFESFLDRMQGLLDNAKKQGHIIVRVEDLENTFPELRKSEDERIRKALIRFHKSTIDIDGIKGDEIVAWLEKQGEQKPFDYENANIQQKDFAPNDEEMREPLRTEYEKGRADTIAEMQKDWSEEDDYNLQCCIAKVQFDIDNGRIGRNRQLLTWLKSLKERVQPQSNWKPSEEQIKALNAINVTGGISYTGQGQVLIALYNDLLKLKE